MDSACGNRKLVPDAGEGVEEVRRRIAPVVQHLVEGEDVVVDAVVGKVGVFDAAESDGSLGFNQLLRSQNLQEDNLQHLNSRKSSNFSH